MIEAPIRINEKDVDINVPLSPLKIEGSRVKCGNCGEIFHIAKRCTFCGQKLKMMQNNNEKRAEFIELLNQYGISEVLAWKEDIRSKLISIFSTKCVGTKYSFKINTTDQTGKIFELYQEECRTRIMGIKQMNEMLFDVFFKKDFYEFVLTKVELPEIRRERNGLVYMKILPEKMWELICAITG